MVTKVIEELTPEAKAEEGIATSLSEILMGAQDLWFQPKAGQCTTFEMEIYVQGQPKRQNARPCPQHLIAEMHKQVDDLLSVGLIRSSPDCKWVAPCHLVPKPRSDKWRLVIDYRYVNSLMQDDSYQMPRIDETLMSLKGFKWFSLIDLNWGFWNVRIDEGSQQFTGFAVPGRGVFTWCVIPFGLKVSPTNFQKAVEMACLLYTSPSPRDRQKSRMPSSA